MSFSSRYTNRTYTHKQFDSDICALQNAVMTMGALVEVQLVRAVDSVRFQDLGIVTQVLEDESKLNQLHVESDLRCNQTIARRQPIAVDLREIIAIIHTINDLERMGDEAKKIALRSRELYGYPLPIELDKVENMTAIVRGMLRSALEAFIRRDTSVAASLNERDSAVDDLRDELLRELMSCMESHPERVSSALTLVFVVQSIERLGDHAKNISEYVVNVVEGVDMRHHNT